MIEREKVKHIAKLARLNLSEKELRKYQKELSKILDYIEKLKDVDISKVKEIFPSTFENVMRKDSQEGKEKRPALLLKLAPEIKDGYLKVKSILSKWK